MIVLKRPIEQDVDESLSYCGSPPSGRDLYPPYRCHHIPIGARWANSVKNDEDDLQKWLRSD
jgi:hypothetical protein